MSRAQLSSARNAVRQLSSNHCRPPTAEQQPLSASSTAVPLDPQQDPSVDGPLLPPVVAYPAPSSPRNNNAVPHPPPPPCWRFLTSTTLLMTPTKKPSTAEGSGRRRSMVVEDLASSSPSAPCSPMGLTYCGSGGDAEERPLIHSAASSRHGGGGGRLGSRQGLGSRDGRFPTFADRDRLHNRATPQTTTATTTKAGVVSSSLSAKDEGDANAAAAAAAAAPIAVGVTPYLFLEVQGVLHAAKDAEMLPPRLLRERLPTSSEGSSRSRPGTSSTSAAAPPAVATATTTTVTVSAASPMSDIISHSHEAPSLLQAAPPAVLSASSSSRCSTLPFSNLSFSANSPVHPTGEHTTSAPPLCLPSSAPPGKKPLHPAAAAASHRPQATHPQPNRSAFTRQAVLRSMHPERFASEHHQHHHRPHHHGGGEDEGGEMEETEGERSLHLFTPITSPKNSDVGTEEGKGGSHMVDHLQQQGGGGRRVVQFLDHNSQERARGGQPPLGNHKKQQQPPHVVPAATNSSIPKPPPNSAPDKKPTTIVPHGVPVAPFQAHHRNNNNRAAAPSAHGVASWKAAVHGLKFLNHMEMAMSTGVMKAGGGLHSRHDSVESTLSNTRGGGGGAAGSTSSSSSPLPRSTSYRLDMSRRSSRAAQFEKISHLKAKFTECVQTIDEEFGYKENPEQQNALWEVVEGLDLAPLRQEYALSHALQPEVCPFDVSSAASLGSKRNQRNALPVNSVVAGSSSQPSSSMRRLIATRLEEQNRLMQEAMKQLQQRRSSSSSPVSPTATASSSFSPQTDKNKKKRGKKNKASSTTATNVGGEREEGQRAETEEPKSPLKTIPAGLAHLYASPDDVKPSEPSSGAAGGGTDPTTRSPTKLRSPKQQQNASRAAAGFHRHRTDQLVLEQMPSDMFFQFTVEREEVTRASLAAHLPSHDEAMDELMVLGLL